MHTQQINALSNALDGVIVSQQMLVMWLTETRQADPAALAELLADYRQSNAPGEYADAVLGRLQAFAKQTAELSACAGESPVPTQ